MHLAVFGVQGAHYEAVQTCGPCAKKGLAVVEGLTFA